MKTIVLSNGQLTQVDDEDYDWLRGFNWSAGGKRDRRYAARGTRSRAQTKVFMHRVLVNAPPDKHVDHINGDTLDNRKANLRICTHKAA